MRSIALSTRTKSAQRQPRGGQALVLSALLIPVLFAMLGLAIDSGRSYVDRRDQQTAVDAAALAAGDLGGNYPHPAGVTPGPPTPPPPAPPHTHVATVLKNIGINGNLHQDTWTDTCTGGYTLTMVATNTL